MSPTRYQSKILHSLILSFVGQDLVSKQTRTRTEGKGKQHSAGHFAEIFRPTAQLFADWISSRSPTVSQWTMRSKTWSGLYPYSVPSSSRFRSKSNRIHRHDLATYRSAAQSRPNCAHISCSRVWRLSFQTYLLSNLNRTPLLLVLVLTMFFCKWRLSSRFFFVITLCLLFSQ